MGIFSFHYKKRTIKEFENLVIGLQDKLYVIAYQYLGNEQDSMDAVANAIEKAYLHYDELKEVSYEKTWITRILINECNNTLSHRKKVISLTKRAEINEKTKRKETCQEEKMDLEEVLSAVEEPQRTMITLKYYQGYSLEEIAEILQMPVGTVKNKMYTTLKQLRTVLMVKEGSL